MLWLNEKDIKKAVTLPEMMDRIEAMLALSETGDFLMPLRSHLDYGGGTLLLMPCCTREAIGTKILTLFRGNAA